MQLLPLRGLLALIRKMFQSFGAGGVYEPQMWAGFSASEKQVKRLHLRQGNRIINLPTSPRTKMLVGTWNFQCKKQDGPQIKIVLGKLGWLLILQREELFFFLEMEE